MRGPGGRGGGGSRVPATQQHCCCTNETLAAPVSRLARWQQAWRALRPTPPWPATSNAGQYQRTHDGPQGHITDRAARIAGTRDEGTESERESARAHLGEMGALTAVVGRGIAAQAQLTNPWRRSRPSGLCLMPAAFGRRAQRLLDLEMACGAPDWGRNWLGSRRCAIGRGLEMSLIGLRVLRRRLVSGVVALSGPRSAWFALREMSSAASGAASHSRSASRGPGCAFAWPLACTLDRVCAGRCARIASCSSLLSLPRTPYAPWIASAPPNVVG